MTTRDTIYSIVSQDVPDQPGFPDGGWGWMVVFGSFLAHFFIGGGIAYSFSIFVTEFIKEYHAEAAWVGSVLLGMTYAIGPIAGALVAQFGCRIVYMIGTVTCTIGFSVSYFANSVVFLLISIGIVGGIGLGLTYLPSVVITSFWFKKKRSFATGLASCGAGLGSFILAPLLKYCVEKRGWKESLAITGGISLLCTSFGILFRPVPKFYRNSDAIILAILHTAEAAQNSGTHEHEHVSDKPSSSREEGFEDIPLESEDEEHEAEADSELEELTVNGPKKVTIDEANNQLFATMDDEKPSRGCRHSCMASGFCLALRSTFNATLWTDSVLLYLCLVHFLASFSASVPLVLVDNLIKNNLYGGKASDEATRDGFIVGSIGLFASVGGCVLGYISDKKCVSRLHLLSTSVAISGVVIALLAYARSVAMFVSCTAIFGLSNGAYAFLTPVVFVDFLGLQKLSSGFGIILLFQGIGTVIAPPIAEALGNFAGLFMAGGVAVASGFMFCFLPCVKKFHKRRRQVALKTLAASKAQSRSELKS